MLLQQGFATPIHEAIRKGKVSQVKQLLREGADISRKDHEGNTALHIAARKGFKKTITLLCEFGFEYNRYHGDKQFDIDAENNNQETALDLARKHQHDEAVELIDDFQAQEPFARALSYIYRGKRAQLKTLLDDDPSLWTETDRDQQNLLHHGVLATKQTGHTCLDILLEYPISHRARNKSQQTPFLLGMAVDLRSFSYKKQRHDFIDSMEHYGSDIEATDAKGFNALYLAALNNNTHGIQILFESKFNIDKVNSDGITPLHLAALCGKTASCKKLIKLGAKTTEVLYPSALEKLAIRANPNDHYLTPLWLAVHGQHVETVNMLFDLMRKTQASSIKALRDVNGGNIMHFFAQTGDKERFNLSAAIGCDASHKNAQGYRPFEKPKKNQHKRQKSKGIVQRYNEHRQYKSELENTTSAQAISLLSVGVNTFFSYAGGPPMMAAQLLNQMFLYATPTIRNWSSRAYYSIKPTIHNNAPRIVETAYDALATTVSYSSDAAFKVLDVADWFANPGRRAAGYVASMTLAHLAASITDNKEWQGAAFAVGRELGMKAVDAYNYYEGVKNAANADQFDVEYSRALTTWISILGKENGEQFVHIMHAFTHTHQTILGYVGWLEHGLLDGVSTTLSYVNELLPDMAHFEKLKAESETFATMLNGYNAALRAPIELFTLCQFQARKIVRLRQQALEEVENAILEHIVPESEYKTYATCVLRANQLALLEMEHKALQEQKTKADNEVLALEKSLVETDEPQAKQDESFQIDLDNAKSEQEIANAALAQHQEKIAAAKTAYETLWQSTPKGAKEKVFNEAEKAHFEALVKVEDLKVDIEYLNQHQITDERLTTKQTELAEAQAQLDVTKTTLATAKSEWKEAINEVERNYFNDHEAEMIAKNKQTITDFVEKKKVSLAEYDAYNVERDALTDTLISALQANQDYTIAQLNLDDIDLRIAAIDRPNAFIASNVVENALSQYPRDAEQAIKIIIDTFVSTGAISREDAINRIQSSLYTAFASRHHKDTHLTKIVSAHWLSLEGDYRTSLYQQRIALQYDVEQKAVLVEAKQAAYQTQYEATQAANQSYADCFDAEQKAQIVAEFNQQALIHHPNNWHVETDAQAIKNTIALVGQPAYVIGVIAHSDGAASNHHIAAFTAKSLIDYKYLFLPAPSIIDRNQEVQALTKQLDQGAVTEQHVAQAKLDMDKVIAQALVGQSAEQIVARLQTGFSFEANQVVDLQLGGQSLVQTLDGHLSAQNQIAAVSAITSALQAKTSQLSIETAGKYVAPVKTPHVPRKPHGLHRIWRHTKDFVKAAATTLTAYTGGVSASINAQGASLGFTNGYQFQVANFNKKVKPLFEIKKPAVAAPAVKKITPSNEVPFPARVPKEPLPKVIALPWERVDEVKLTAPSVKPLIFRTPEKVVPMQGVQRVARSQAQTQSIEWDISSQVAINPLSMKPSERLSTSQYSQLLAAKGIILPESVLVQSVVFIGMYFKALQEPKNPLVIAWQADNQERFPWFYETYKEARNYRLSDLRYVYYGMMSAAESIENFKNAESNRIALGQETVIGKAIRETTAFLHNHAEMFASAKKGYLYVRDEFGRLVRNEPTQTGNAFGVWVNSFENSKKEDMLHKGGEELFYIMLAEGVFRGLGYSAEAAIPMLGQKLDSSFFSQYRLQWPIEFNLEPGRLYSGPPLDQLKLQAPLYRKAAERAAWEHVPDNATNALKLKVQLTLQESGILDATGRLTPEAIGHAREALSTSNSVIGYAPVVKELTKDGSKIEEWMKFKTVPVKGASGQTYEVHFYQNTHTKEVNYTVDYKVKALITEPYKYRIKAKEDHDLISAVIGRNFK